MHSRMPLACGCHPEPRQSQQLQSKDNHNKSHQSKDSQPAQQDPPHPSMASIDIKWLPQFNYQRGRGVNLPRSSI